MQQVKASISTLENFALHTFENDNKFVVIFKVCISGAVFVTEGVVECGSASKSLESTPWRRQISCFK